MCVSPELALLRGREEPKPALLTAANPVAGWVQPGALFVPSEVVDFVEGIGTILLVVVMTKASDCSPWRLASHTHVPHRCAPITVEEMCAKTVLVIVLVFPPSGRIDM